MSVICTLHNALEWRSLISIGRDSMTIASQGPLPKILCATIWALVIKGDSIFSFKIHFSSKDSLDSKLESKNKVLVKAMQNALGVYANKDKDKWKRDVEREQVM